MLKIPFLLVVISIVMMVCSCFSSSLKVNSLANNTSNLKEKNDLVISGSGGVAMGNDHLQLNGEIQGAYAITDKNGIYFNGLTNIPLDKKYKMIKNLGIELGYGYNITNDANNKHTIISGIGYQNNHTKKIRMGNGVITRISEYQLSTTNMYLQYNYSKEFKHVFSSLSTKLNYVQFYNLTHNDGLLRIDSFQVSNIYKNSKIFLLEPQLEVGWTKSRWYIFYIHKVVIPIYPFQNFGYDKEYTNYYGVNLQVMSLGMRYRLPLSNKQRIKL